MSTGIIIPVLMPDGIAEPRKVVMNALAAYNPVIYSAWRSENADVGAFHRKFGLARPAVPSFLPDHAAEFRRKFMQEELDEWVKAVRERDMHGAADALVDLAYVVHGTADMMGIPWYPVWAEVQRVNMMKERAKSASQSKRGSSLDVIKPPGWTPPDHTPTFGHGPWPILDY